ncbi:MAG: AIPR family protein [Verrucomicrobiales bacterium]|nr:AIPR family protein [Verrucomicrobiales bacterium]
MDRITKSLLKEHSDEYGIHTEKESDQFEHFSSYLMTLRHFTDSFTPDEVVIGSGGDTGIDGIAIIVNGSFVVEPEEIEDLVDTNGYLDVTFVFVQAETSSSFNTQKIGQFGYGVQDFISEHPSLVRNDSISQKAEVFSEIYERSSKFTRGNPSAFLYYVTTGKWTEDQNLDARRGSVETDILSTGLFEKVSMRCYGASELQSSYRDSKNAIACEIAFAEKVTLPEMKGVQQAYIGVLPVNEYKKLIHNEDSEIIHSLFYDNVRHWQEWNPVNTEIQGTLKDETEQQYFPIFNNGVTVVAKNIQPTGNKLLIEDYQVVNGCQTSYVIHETLDDIDDGVRVPVRLIATVNQDIKNSIIKATNRQTTVGDDQLIALTDFPKKLEDFFPSFDGKKRLFYERRSRQYSGQDGIEKVRIINMTMLVRSFASVFLDLPHRTTRNYKSLLKSIGSDIFNPDDRLEMYYLSAFLHYRLEQLFRAQTIDRELKVARYHLLMAFRYLAVTDNCPTKRNSADMQRYCDKVLEVAWDDVKSEKVFQQAVAVVKGIAAGNFHRDNIRTEPFTNGVRKKI